VEVVKGRAAVLFDSGIRSGLDIMRALALGADFVLLGRAFQYGVAALGQRGGDLVTELLIADLKNNMSQTGCASLKEICGMRKMTRGRDTAPPSEPHPRTSPSSGFSLDEDAR
jgi:isopentenyl diphosphate isomerase/L-lactate dehydrogenase-like FMN-dependent dehydrogenase